MDMRIQAVIELHVKCNKQATKLYARHYCVSQWFQGDFGHQQQLMYRKLRERKSWHVLELSPTSCILYDESIAMYVGLLKKVLRRIEQISTAIYTHSVTQRSHFLLEA